ncbi:MAG: hypothetical protein OHK006_00630 [Thermodesulfovibrionales bacterium]
MLSARGKSLKAITRDIADGYVTVNPIFLKPFQAEALKELHAEMSKAQAEVRSEKFPFSDIEAIRLRNLRLQRLYSALVVIKNFAKERRISLV